jgi:hypothetical protein
MGISVGVTVTHGSNPSVQAFCTASSEYSIANQASSCTGTRKCASDFPAYPPRQRWVRDVPAYRARCCPRIIAYPPRQRWAPDATAYDLLRRGSDGHACKGHSINNPPLTRWVCAGEPFVCRLHHHGPTSNEVGMRENGTRTDARPRDRFLHIRFIPITFSDLNHL